MEEPGHASKPLPPVHHSSSTTHPAPPIGDRVVVVAAPAPAQRISGLLEENALASLLQMGTTSHEPIPSSLSRNDPSRSHDADSDHSGSTHETCELPAAEKKQRHNATERRRVQRLKEAYTALDRLVRSRPDILAIQPKVPEAKVSGGDGSRKRGRQAEEGGSGASSSPASHLETLEGTAAGVSELFDLVDQLMRRNADLEAQLKVARC